MVISSAERAADTRRPVPILGVAEGHPDSPSVITQRPDITRLGLAKAAPRAFGMAGVGPEDVDVAEVYDCFTWTVICQLEDLGFCPKGEGGAFVEGGRIGLDGALPVNTHGGLLSQAHIVGMNHVCELVKQMRGEAGRGAGGGRRNRPRHGLWRTSATARSPSWERRRECPPADGRNNNLPPAPEPTIDSKPYWDGLKERRLLLQQCGNCGLVRHYPRPMLRRLHSLEVRWIEILPPGPAP